MPALVLAPIIGWVADRCDKRLTMAGCDTLAGVSAALLTLLSVSSSAAYNTPSEHSHYRVCLAFFLLTFCQQSFTAQYTSLRKSFAAKAKASEARSTLTMVVGFGIGVVAYAALFLAVVERAHPNKGHLGNGGRVASLAASAFLRSISSSPIWVFSTLVVQIKILGSQGGNPWENPIFGWVFALEMSMFTAGKLGSFVLGGAGIGLFSCGCECAC